jgi:glycosyltransferase involved in cell wall biosynthesis
VKIAYITPGSGDTFYCQNCFRDDELLHSLLLQGQDVQKIPMYLPSGMASHLVPDSPVFYGAINLYLKEKVPFYRHAPSWMERAMDSQPLLRYAAKKSGSTSASGLEGMTISMLQGEQGRQAEELDSLIHHLKTEVKPDIVHLSNALLLGVVRRIRQDVGARVVCSLQDENEWVDEMDGTQQTIVWGLMGEKAADVDVFLATSRFYSLKRQELLEVPAEKISVIDGGINLEGYEPSPLPFDPPVLGYLCRMSEYFGLGILVDAFLELKKESRFNSLKLFLTGGYTGLDKPFVDRMMLKIRDAGWGDDVRIFREFDKKSRFQFLKSLTLLSVPVPSGEAFGAYQVEALASGVPVVQPDVGCYPEFVEATGGGIIYGPNTPANLAQAAASLLDAPDRLRRMGAQGREVVLRRYSMDSMTREILSIYRTLMEQEG